MGNDLRIRGQFVHSPERGRIEVIRNGTAVVRDGRLVSLTAGDVLEAASAPRGNATAPRAPGEPVEVLRGGADPERVRQSATDALPEAELPLLDFGRALLIPSFCDMHLHAPQHAQLGVGMDLELLEWLNRITFPNEASYADLAHARRAYARFAASLVREGTLSCSVYGTVHADATLILADELKKAGVRAWVGKVSMSRLAPPELIETEEQAISEIERFIAAPVWDGQTRPVVTPRFAISCTMPLMRRLSGIALRHGLPVQSHLSENADELAVVGELFPDISPYWRVYEAAGLFGGTPTLMAHCIHVGPDARRAMRENGVTAVHCPSSNVNLSSGVMDATGMLDDGVPMALGSDIGGGSPLSMPRTILEAMHASRIRRMFVPGSRAMTFEEAFWLATKAGGDVFGDTGCFLPGRRFDALAIDDASLVCDASPEREAPWWEEDPSVRLQRWVYAGDDRQIAARFSAGRRLET